MNFFNGFPAQVDLSEIAVSTWGLLKEFDPYPQITTQKIYIWEQKKLTLTATWDDIYNYAYTGNISGTISGLTNPGDYYIESLSYVTGDNYYSHATGPIGPTGEFGPVLNWTGYKQIRIKRYSDDVCIGFINYESGTGQTAYDDYFFVSGWVEGIDPADYGDYEVKIYDVTDTEYLQNTVTLDGTTGWWDCETNSIGGILPHNVCVVKLLTVPGGVVVTKTYEVNGLNRSYVPPPGTPDPVAYEIMVNRVYCYDQGLSLLAACVIGDWEWSSYWAKGALTVLKAGDNGQGPFSVNNISAMPPDLYLRTGGSMWLYYALAKFYLLWSPTYPTDPTITEAYDILDDYMDDLIANYWVEDVGSLQHHSFRGGQGRYEANGIISVEINGTTGASGSGYSIDDILTVIQGGNVTGTLKVTGETGGVITSLSINAGGSGYTVADGLSTTSLGGTGCIIDITEVGTVFNPTYIVPWCSTEHNVDAWFVLDALFAVYPASTYDDYRDELENSLLTNFWYTAENRAYQGISDDVTPDDSHALDCGSWYSCFARAVGATGKANMAIDSIRPYVYTDTDVLGTGKKACGYTPYIPPYYPLTTPGVWIEGSCGCSLAFLAGGRKDMALKIIWNAFQAKMTGVEKYQRGYPYCTIYDVLYEVSDWSSVASTAWIILACYPNGQSVNIFNVNDSLII